LCWVCSVIWFAVAVPWSLRAALCLAVISFNTVGIRRCVLLLGSDAVRALEWLEPGEFTVRLGVTREALPAMLAGGSFRLGGLVVLRFQTPRGMRAVLIDGGRQEIRAFRRLCRRLCEAGRGAKPAVPGVPGSRADTIRPKV